MSRSVGIDLGTTYSAVAYIDDFGKPMIVKNSDGLTTTPSAVFIDTPSYVVGEVALQSTLSDPDRVVQFIKRFMGVPNYRARIGEKTYSPEFISSLILRKLIQEAENALDESITSAVITVPAYFTESQRQATYEAAQLAGLTVMRIINEPTAAALNYGAAQRGRDARILVYDLGGGTFDVTILEVRNDELTVIGVGGDAQLGGKDFDERIMNFVEEQMRENYGADMQIDHFVEAELRLKAEGAKRQISGRNSVPITFKAKRVLETERGATDTYVPVRVELSREKFESLTADLLSRTELLLNNVLYKSSLTWSDIDEVLCVGGSSKMPMVREMLTRVTGKKPLMQDPDECVALGAAVQAGLLSNDTALQPIKVSHVLSHSLGVATMRDGKTVIDQTIPALTALPCIQLRNNYTTSIDNQTLVQISIFEGESNDPDAYANGPIGSFELDASPPRPKGQPQISVEFRCDENGRIVAVARDSDTGRESRTMISLNASRGAGEAEEESRMLAEAIIC